MTRMFAPCCGYRRPYMWAETSYFRDTSDTQEGLAPLSDVDNQCALSIPVLNFFRSTAGRFSELGRRGAFQQRRDDHLNREVPVPSTWEVKKKMRELRGANHRYAARDTLFLLWVSPSRKTASGMWMCCSFTLGYNFFCCCHFHYEDQRSGSCRGAYNQVVNVNS
jgi:hypothetical protein